MKMFQRLCHYVDIINKNKKSIIDCYQTQTKNYSINWK